MIHSELSPRYFHFILLAACGAVLFLFLGLRALTPLEANTALAARQAGLTRPTVTDVIQTMDLQIYPLWARTTRVGGYIFGGVHEWSTRLPGCLVILGAGILAFVTAHRKFGIQAGGVAFAAVCISIPGMLAARAHGGSAIAALLISAAWLGWFVFGWERQRWVFAWSGSLLLVLLAALQMGWLAFLFYYMPLLFLRRPLRAWPYLASLTHTLALGLALLVFSAWFFWIHNAALPLAHLEPAFGLWPTSQFYLGRFITFPVHCLVLFTPWIFFAWPAYCAAFHQLEKHPAFVQFLHTLILPLFLMAWLIPPFKPGHLLPLLVPAGILCGVHYEILVRRHKNRLAQLSRSIGVIAIAPAIIGGLLLILHISQILTIDGLTPTRAIAGLSLLITGMALLSAFFYHQNKLPCWLQTAAPLALLAVFIICAWLPPYAALQEDVRSTGQYLAASVPDDAKVYVLEQVFDPDLGYYLNRPLELVPTPASIPRRKSVVYVLGGYRPPIQETRNWEAISEPWSNNEQPVLRLEYKTYDALVAKLSVHHASSPSDPESVIRMYRGSLKELSPNLDTQANETSAD